MIEEIEVRQLDDDPHRRWFSDEFFDPIVWYRANASILGFQLCYDKQRRERAITWLPEDGYSHRFIDPGDDDPRRDKPAMLTQSAGVPDPAVRDAFEASSVQLPASIRELVLARLVRYPVDPPPS